MKNTFSSVCVVIPAYNEELSIGTFLKDIQRTLKNAEIVVVDDGSNDQTQKVVLSFSGVRLIKHDKNQGYGRALRTGIEATKKKFVVWADSDGQHRAEDVLKIAKKLTEKNLDYCIGIRKKDSYFVPNRKVGKFILGLLVRFAAGKNVGDFNSGLRGFKTATLNKYLHLLPKGFGASTTTTLLMAERNYQGEFVQIKALERKGKSSVRQIYDGLMTCVIISRIYFLFKPIRFFGGVGSFLILIGCIYGFLETVKYGLGFPVFAAILITSGIQTLFFGLLMDQISGIRREKFE